MLGCLAYIEDAAAACCLELHFTNAWQMYETYINVRTPLLSYVYDHDL